MSRFTPGWGLILLVVGASLGACRSNEHAPPVDRARLQQQARDHIAHFSGARGAIGSPASLTEEPCPDDDIEATLDGGYGRLLLAEKPVLDRFDHPDDPVYRGADAPFQILTSPELAAIDPAPWRGDDSGLIAATYALQKLARAYRYLAVLIPTRRELPRIEGTKFHAGNYTAWLVVTDLERSRRLCQAQLSVSSSPQVAGVVGQAREQVLLRDFRRHLVAELHATTKRLTRRLELTLE